MFYCGFDDYTKGFTEIFNNQSSEESVIWKWISQDFIYRITFMPYTAHWTPQVVQWINVCLLENVSRKGKSTETEDKWLPGAQGRNGD